MIFTFYSFKGGVGRSMALANIAELLYTQGLKVLMVDFDLEAPGLEQYFDTNVDGHRGVIDMLCSYRELRSYSPPPPPDAKGEFVHSVEPLESFVQQIYGPNERGGTLDLMPAGNRLDRDYSDYAQRVLGFNWKNFYLNQDGEAFFEWFRQSVERQYDVVLVDSRTGVTEMGGVCTHQLADVVVSLVTTNRQNLEGTKMMAASLRNSELKKRRGGRDLNLLFVPARVELSERDKHDEFARDFNATFEPLMPGLRWRPTPFVDLKLSYVPAYAYMEAVAVREPERASNADLIAQFNRLCARMVALADPETRLGRAYGEVGGERFGTNADKVYEELDAGGKVGMRELFRRLFPAGGVPAEDVDHLPAELIARLVRAQLVTSGKEIAFTDAASARAWLPAAEWWQKDQPLVEARKRLNSLRQPWELAGRSRKYLLSGSLLKAYRSLSGNYLNALNSAERRFLDASRANRTLSIRLKVTAAIFVVAVLISWLNATSVRRNLIASATEVYSQHVDGRSPASNQQMVLLDNLRQNLIAIARDGEKLPFFRSAWRVQDRDISEARQAYYSRFESWLLDPALSKLRSTSDAPTRITARSMTR